MSDDVYLLLLFSKGKCEFASCFDRYAPTPDLMEAAQFLTTGDAQRVQEKYFPGANHRILRTERLG